MKLDILLHELKDITIGGCHACEDCDLCSWENCSYYENIKDAITALETQ